MALRVVRQRETAPEAPDFNDLPEWTKLGLSQSIRSRASRPEGESMEEQGKNNPDDWYNLPEWMRTDILRSRGFGLSTPDEEKQRTDAARAEMLRQQTAD